MSTAEKTEKEWQRTNAQIFWGEIAPTDHVVQIYENDAVFLDLLEGYVVGGLNNNECIVLIATPEHLKAVKTRLQANQFDLEALIIDDQLILLDAEETLNRFMVNGWPNEGLFNQTVSEIIQKANSKQRNIRAFGEMVALLWAKGLNGATVQLESLWNRFCEKQKFCLFCAYPKNGFTQEPASSLESICCSHSKMISGHHISGTEIFYKTMS